MSKETCNNKFSFFAVAIAFSAATFLFLSYCREPASNLWKDVDKNGCEKTFAFLMSKYKQCLLEKLGDKTKKTHLNTAVEKCMGDTMAKILDLHLLENDGDVKLAILPQSSSKNRNDFDCVEVTLGVGGDIESEKKLRALIPHCRFYGADPIRAGGEPFKEMGAYFEIAVGPEAGVLTASVLENGAYRNKTVPTITLVDFLKNHAKVDHVDFLFMDNEGAEYGLFKQLQQGGAIEQSGISICQITVEMHLPPSSYGIDDVRFDQLIWSTVNSSSYLPVWSVFGGGQLRSFYLNVQDQYCLKTFLSKKFWG